MSELTFDLIVIGSGPGGYVAAIRASQLGMKVCIVEKENLGGVCLNLGCIPSKALLKSAELFQEFKKASEFGINVENITHDFSKVVKRSRKVALINSKGVEFLMKKNKVTVVSGKAVFKDKKTLSILDQSEKEIETLTAPKILVATGARSHELPSLPIDGKNVLGYREAIVMETQPKSAVIVGAGAIGMEFAYVWGSFGTDVTVVEFADRVLPLEDPDSSKVVEADFKKLGIKAMTSASVESAKASSSGVDVLIQKKEGTETLKVDVVLSAVGVRPNTEGMGLDKIGVDLTKQGFIKVNLHTFETSVPGIFAIGDVAGPPMLAHKASLEGINCVEGMAGQTNVGINYDLIPKATYCQPQVASVGLTEEQAKEKGYEVTVGKFPFQASGKARAVGHTSGHVKVIFDKKYGEVIGTHIVGSDATEMIAEATLAHQLEATPGLILKTSHAHPTLSEAFLEAVAASVGEAIHI